MDVSENRGTPKSSILIGFSIIFTIHFGGNTPIFGNPQMTPQIPNCPNMHEKPPTASPARSRVTTKPKGTETS